MIINLKIRRARATEFVINVLSHIVSNGAYEPDNDEPYRWRIDMIQNNWWARVEDGVLTISGRYADDATMQAVKQMLMFRCDKEVQEL